MVWVGDVPIGAGTVTLIAGSCAVEFAEPALPACLMARAGGPMILRGGAPETRTSPYAFQGPGGHALRILTDIRAGTGLPFVTEVITPQGDLGIVLCERGIRTFETARRLLSMLSWTTCWRGDRPGPVHRTGTGSGRPPDLGSLPEKN